MRKSKYISGGGETLKTVSTIDNGMRAKIPANSELEGTIMQLHPGAPPVHSARTYPYSWQWSNLLPNQNMWPGLPQHNENKAGLQYISDGWRWPEKRESSPAWHCGMEGCGYPSTPTPRSTSSPTPIRYPPEQVLHRLLYVIVCIYNYPYHHPVCCSDHSQNDKYGAASGVPDWQQYILILTSVMS